ncbi:hypothetical protein G9A89_007263 [Geosiphon pyriformis]|nr:hypothetical protein G9A89_007263 [Geosiphon pyriformis]
MPIMILPDDVSNLISWDLPLDVLIHIVSQLLDNASISHVWKLRATSRSFKEACETAIFDHLRKRFQWRIFAKIAGDSWDGWALKLIRLAEPVLRFSFVCHPRPKILSIDNDNYCFWIEAKMSSDRMFRPVHPAEDWQKAPKTWSNIMIQSIWKEIEGKKAKTVIVFGVDILSECHLFGRMENLFH